MTFIETGYYSKKIEKKFKSYSRLNYQSIDQIQSLPNEIQENIDVLSRVFPFRVNNYVIEELIDWKNPKEDPMFILTFPQKEMLFPHQYDALASLIQEKASKEKINELVQSIRLQLNPNPAGQMDLNVPEIFGQKQDGIQHKYKETVLVFPKQGQTCHAYCTFCFRWPQFTGMDNCKFVLRDVETMTNYLSVHKEVTDVLITGGDPMIMKTKFLKEYINAILYSDLDHIKTIRIGTKSLSYWPYRYFSDNDSEELIELFKKVKKFGKHLSIMAHFNHPKELSTQAVSIAVEKIKSAGATIRTQSPLIKNINDDSNVWAEMWKKQVNMGMIPYYMFVERDTGANHYFALPLEKCWEIYKGAYNNVSGIVKTVRGPNMSCTPGKIEVIGISEVNGEKVFVLKMVQGRNPEWVNRPFFAKYDPSANWLTNLKPAFGQKKFFFEN